MCIIYVILQSVGWSSAGQCPATRFSFPSRMKSNVWIGIQGCSDLVIPPNGATSSWFLAANFYGDYKLLDILFLFGEVTKKSRTFRKYRHISAEGWDFLYYK